MSWVPAGTWRLLSSPVAARLIHFIAFLRVTSVGQKLHHMPADTLRHSSRQQTHARDRFCSPHRVIEICPTCRPLFLSLLVHVQEFRSDCGVWLLLIPLYCRRGSCTAKWNFLFSCSFLLFTFMLCGSSLWEHITFLLPRVVFSSLGNPQSSNAL